MIINTDKIPDKLNLGKTLLLILLKEEIDIQEIKTNLLEEGLITEILGDNLSKTGKFRPTKKGLDLLIDTIVTSELQPTKEEDENILKLAIELKKIFPKGKKPGTSFYWSDGIILISKRLKLFFKKYGYYDNNIIIQATRNYVASFKEDYRFMRILKYFILKEDVGNGGDVESKSELLSYIENIEDNNEEIEDWNVKLI